MKTPYKLSLLLVLLHLTGSLGVMGQVSINTDGSNPDPSAMLEIKSDNSGFLLPRIDFNNRPSSPTAGLVIYVTANGPLGNGIYIWGDRGWAKINTTPAYSMGQHVGGGVIFYIDPSGQHGLISSETDQPNIYPFGCDTLTMIGTSTDFGTGNLNTAAIIAACPAQDIAANVCDTSTHGGFSDWFLPSRDELDSMHLHKAMIGGFIPGWYWSSSEVSEPGAWFVSFNPVYPWIDALTSKFSYLYVRCIRNF